MSDIREKAIQAAFDRFAEKVDCCTRLYTEPFMSEIIAVYEAALWQPIETAPVKQWIMTYVPDMKPGPRIWHFGTQAEVDQEQHFTHWRPLLPPPGKNP